ncbi:MAG TPA: lysine exporter LysO family protein, partial [Clostridiales bacterium]|nr:lysine exporter LysO family protein [Clostridiales bacterium]
MTISILVAVAAGIFFGRFFFPIESIGCLSALIDIGLCILLFFVGMDIGRNKEIWPQVKTIGLKMLLIPIMIAFGSIVGSIIGGMFLGIPINESSAIGAGFGWY